MVKAFSYGSGGYEIANVLQYNHIDYLAVAFADEGVELRKAGITTPIMVMNAEKQSYDAMINYDLEPEIFSIRVLKAFEEVVRKSSYQSKSGYPIHLKFDTGMHRLGFEENEIDDLVLRLNKNKLLSVKKSRVSRKLLFLFTDSQSNTNKAANSFPF